jgi:hypothetical protein
VSDWASERAEQIINLLITAPRASAVDVLASLLRVAKEEGVSDGMARAFKVDDATFDKVFGSRS